MESIYEIREKLQAMARENHEKHGQFILRGFCRCGARGMPGTIVCTKWAKIDDALISMDGSLGQFDEDEVTIRTEVTDELPTSDESKLQVRDTEDSSQ